MGPVPLQGLSERGASQPLLLVLLSPLGPARGMRSPRGAHATLALPTVGAESLFYVWQGLLAVPCSLGCHSVDCVTKTIESIKCQERRSKY